MKVIIKILITRPRTVELDINDNFSIIDLKRKIFELYKINVLNENVLFNKIKKKDQEYIEISSLINDYEIIIVKNFSFV